MSDWKVGFKCAMIDALIEGGQPVRADPSIYGWADYDWRSEADGTPHPRKQRILSVGVDYERTEYREVDWYEFAGTFADSDNHKYGVDLDVVLLNGETVHMRYDGTLSRLIKSVLDK